VGLRLEDGQVRVGVGPLVRERVVLDVFVLEEVAFLVAAEARGQEVLVDVLDQPVHAPELVVDGEARVGDRGRGDAHGLEHLVGQRLVQERRILDDVVEHELLEAVELLVGDVFVGVDEQARLVASREPLPRERTPTCWRTSPSTEMFAA
jgi:hypothetical protein